VTNEERENWFDESLIRPNPVTAVAAIGLTPISPVMVVAPVVVTPVFDRIAKLPADPRFTPEAAWTPGIIAAVIRKTRAIVKNREKIFPVYFVVLFMIYSPGMVSIHAGRRDILPGMFHFL
jgi:hypothetical protein